MSTSTSTITAGRRRLAATALAILACAGASASVANAAPQLSFTSLSAGALNADGTPATQAGAHPFELTSSFEFDTVVDPRAGQAVPAASLKDTVFDLPPGVVGNPNAVPQCSQQELNSSPSFGACPAASQVGYAVVKLAYLFGYSAQEVPIFNMVPPPGQPAQFAFVVVVSVVHIDLKVRSDGDYGVTAIAHNANAGVPLYGAEVHLWGVPGDPAHDAHRGGQSSGLSRTPLLRNPTSCTGPVVTAVRATSYQEPDQVTEGTVTSPANTGCANVPFAPTISVAPDTRKAGASAGLGVDIDVPQDEDPYGVATADVKRVVMKLPAGVAINPSAADGLQGCRDSDFAIKSKAEDQCPDGSNIGTATITSPLLKNPVKGSVFLASPLEQGPIAAAAGDMFRLFITGEVAGVRVKLAGSVVPDPVTGQLTTTFDNNPQLPFSNLHLQLTGGPRAPLSTPKACGTYTTTAELTPWTAPEGAPVEASSSFTIDQNCDQAGKFEPSLNAGLTSSQAGGSSPFTMTLSRPDGQQDIAGLEVTLPPGLLGNVGRVAQCPEVLAASGNCDRASQVGKVTVGSGSGATPLQVPQPGKTPTAVFLAGPYKGAPFSLSIVVPAQAGPFDLGTVVVRAAIFVDPIDGHVTVKSDPLPTKLLGVPLNVQKINVVIDRPGFMVAPTNCSSKSIGALATSVTGAAVTLANRFQVVDCAALGLKPRLALALSGKGQTTDGKHPTVTASLTQLPGQANLKKVRVALPLSVALDPDNAASDGLCSFVEGSKADPQCPASSVIGKATAITPVLDGPVTGPVYFVKNERKDPKSGRSIRTLPKLVIPLVGQNGVKLVLTGTSDVVDNQLVSTFDAIPDAPVSDFKLEIAGGKKGILVVTGDKADICKANQIAEQRIDGQNGKVAAADITIQTPSCPTKVISKKITKSTVALKIGGLGAGKVTVTGSGIKKTNRTIAQATVTTITAHRTKARLGKVKVSFTPNGAKKPKTATTTLH